MQLIIGIIIGICICHYWPSQAEKVAVDTRAVIHEGANAVSKATEPKSTLDKIKEKF